MTIELSRKKLLDEIEAMIRTPVSTTQLKELVRLKNYFNGALLGARIINLYSGNYITLLLQSVGIVGKLFIRPSYVVHLNQEICFRASIHLVT